MFSCRFSFLLKSKGVHGNVFHMSMFIPISSYSTIHVKFCASLVPWSPRKLKNDDSGPNKRCGVR